MDIDSDSSSELPQSALTAEKAKTLDTPRSSNMPVIRRTHSLDTIHVYLKGHWPKENFSNYCGNLLVDKITQTPDDWLMDRPRKSDSENLERLIRQKLQRNNKEVTGRALRHSPVHADHSVTVAKPVPIPVVRTPTPRTRNSVEGLNQEIEKLVLKGLNDDDGLQFDATPDGHRAPIAELLLDVDTQTPLSDTCSSTPSPRHDLDNGYDDYDMFLGSSPQINRFLARAPPDGCEKVSIKYIEQDRVSFDELLKPTAPCELKLSTTSAFCPLYSKRNTKYEAVIEIQCGRTSQ